MSNRCFKIECRPFECRPHLRLRSQLILYILGGWGYKCESIAQSYKRCDEEDFAGEVFLYIRKTFNSGSAVQWWTKSRRDLPDICSANELLLRRWAGTDNNTKTPILRPGRHYFHLHPVRHPPFTGRSK